MFKALQGRTSTLNTLHNQWSHERMPSKMLCFKKGLLVLLPSLRQGGDSSSCGCDVFCTSFAMDAHSCLAQMALVWQAEAYSEQLWGRLLQIVQRNTFSGEVNFRGALLECPLQWLLTLNAQCTQH